MGFRDRNKKLVQSECQTKAASSHYNNNLLFFVLAKCGRCIQIVLSSNLDFPREEEEHCVTCVSYSLLAHDSVAFVLLWPVA